MSHFVVPILDEFLTSPLQSREAKKHDRTVDVDVDVDADADVDVDADKGKSKRKDKDKNKENKPVNKDAAEKVGPTVCALPISFAFQLQQIVWTPPVTCSEKENDMKLFYGMCTCVQRTAFFTVANSACQQVQPASGRTGSFSEEHDRQRVLNNLR